MTSPNNLTDREVLEQVISRAIEGGWDGGDTAIKPKYWNHPKLGEFYRKATVEGWLLNLEGIIFRHDLASILWGVKRDSTDPRYWPAHKTADQAVRCTPWQYHLQRMVISDNPIDYLRQYLKENE